MPWNPVYFVLASAPIRCGYILVYLKGGGGRDAFELERVWFMFGGYVPEEVGQ